MCAVGRRAAELVVSGKDAQEAPQRSFSTSSRDMPTVSNYIKGDFRSWILNAMLEPLFRETSICAMRRT